MTLNEKFDNLDSSSKDRMDIFYHDSDKCVEIADDYAIEFGNWLNNQVINVSGRHHNLLGTTKVTQLLPIFKKEKGL
jgi:hypothetical protein